MKQRFIGSNAAQRAALQKNLLWFIDAYPKDGSTPLATVYLALIAVDQGDVARARAFVDEARTGPSGTARDLSELVEGKILLRRGDSVQAFERLLPIVGKLIDPYARLLLDESIVAAAIGAHRWYEAVAYMDLWLRDGQEDEAEVVRRGVRRNLEAVPADALETMLKAMQGENGRTGYGTEIRRAVVARLASVALADQDTDLARRLVDSTDDQSLGEAAEGLEELASSGGAPTVDGRTIGLLVSTGKSQLGVRAAQVLTGVVDALRSGGGAPDHVRLATRDERDTKRTDLALLSLASHGAAIIIAGFDPAQADVAARFAARTHLPVLLLSPLSDGAPPPPPAFLLGASREAVAQALAEHLKTKGARSIAAIGGHLTEAASRGLSLLPEGSCDAAAEQAGESRFPLTAWQKGRIDALLLLGDATCTSEAIIDTAAGKLGRVRAAVGLDAAEIASEPSPLPLSVASAGRFPLTSGNAGSPLFGFKERHGQAPSWFATIGHDAAVLARAAMRTLPTDSAEHPAEVASRHQRAQASLRGVEVELWSTTARGFSGGFTIERDLQVTEVR
ncbi:MAG TPA: hypothetical protein VK550_07600 [Polyangiaceae bacterium]|nr:hypothetical protein [Polyangiaceae bacterium]